MNTKYNVGFDLKKMMESLPEGLDKQILKILSFRVGREKAISRAEMVRLLARHGYKVDEREMRAAINLLRKNEVLICSTGGKNGGYWIGESYEDVIDFCEKEITPRINDLAKTRSSLLDAARKKWKVSAEQPKLF